MNNQFNEVFSFFASLYPEFSPGHRIIDIFPNHFFFNLFSKYKDNNFKAYIQQLDNLAIKSLRISLHALIIMDTSIKNSISISISHIHIHNRSITKTLYHIVNVTSTEAKLFAIRYGINQATNHNDVLKIIVVTNLIHTTKKIFNTIFHPYQVHTAFILNKLCTFFSYHQENLIKFWKYSNCSNWALYKAIDKEIKSFNPILLFSCKSL